MQKNGQKKNNATSNVQEKLKDAVISIPGDNPSPNQSHNVKKEALGPNTKR